MLAASFLIALSAPSPAVTQATPAPAQTDAPRVLDVRANDFTRSSQDAVVLAANGQGTLALAWQSRRQQDGFYGIYLRGYSQDGRVLTSEVQGNANVAGHQMQPSAAMSADGSVWLTWRSFGADGDQGSIIARRFAGDLASATAEVLVNEQTAGHQTDPLIAALPNGEALVVWLSPAPEGLGNHVLARRIDADGEPAGKTWRVDSGKDARHSNPTLATDAAGRTLVAYARADASGSPAGVFLRQVEQGATSGAEVRLDQGDQAGVEPVLALDDEGRAIAAWLAAVGEDYSLFTRSLTWGDESLELQEKARLVTITGEGYTSGISVSLDGQGKGLLAWTRHTASETGADLLAQWIDTQGVPTGEAFIATESDAGAQRLDPARGTARSLVLPNGLAAFAWTGEAGLGDSSGANLTLLGGPDKFVRNERTEARVALAVVHGESDEENSGARPHDPPVYDPRQASSQDDIHHTSSLGSGNFDFQAFNNTGWTPPDPEMAVGPDHIVAMVNGGIGWFLKDGTSQFFQDINGSGGFWGSVTSSGFVFDPEVVWDSHSGRFVVFASDGGSGAGLLLSVSDDSNPNGNWDHYLIPTSGLFGAGLVDSGNLAVDEDFITITGDIFGPDRLVMVFIEKASAFNGGPLVFETEVITGRQSMGTATNYDANPRATFMAWARETASANAIDIYAVTDRDTSFPTVQNVQITVPTYEAAADPPQMGTSVRPNLFEQRFWSAMVRDDQLWATHHQGTPRPRVTWYQFDLAGWPQSGNQPTLVQTGQVDLGAPIRTYFPSIWVDDQQNMALTFAQSSANEFISMNMAFRLAGDPQGTTRPPLRIIDSNSPDTSGRWGDYCATNDDPSEANTFWGIHEYNLGGSWRTRLARIDTSGCTGVIQGNCVTSPNSAGSGALMAVGGSTSLAANDLVLNAAGCPANQFGIFFYGPDQVQVVNGDGFLCVGGGLFRLPAVNTGVAGIASFPLDNTNLPLGGTIAVGNTFNFQFWFRDPPAGGSGYNFSDAVAVTFCD